jgi:predicted anti-sigma-YlaC factor YlaD
MNKHPVEAEELQAYLDKELAPARQAEVSRHVQACQECSAMIADLQRVSATLQRWQIEPAPANLKPPVMPAEKKERSFSWQRLAFTLSGAVVVVLIIAAISVPNLLRSRYSVPTGPLEVQQAQPYLNATAGDRSTHYNARATSVAPEGGRPEFELGAGRMVAYQVSMTVEVKEFEAAKSKLRQIMDAEGGYITNSNFVETPNQPKRASLVLRVPAAKLQTILNEVRALGRVKEEHLNSEEVTDQVVDLEARLKNARATEQRLIEVLNNRTGKVSDILQVEREIARTREQIERMEAQRQNLMKRVEMATVSLTLAEEFKAQLAPTPVGTGTQLWNALVDGYENFAGSILGIAFFLARYGLSLILWGGIGWLTWRAVRRPFKRILGARN